MIASGYLVAPEKIEDMPARILLVEDAEADVALVREALEQCGLDFDMQVFEDGESAVDFVESIDRGSTLSCPDLILLDLNLPKKSGTQVLGCVRSSQACANVPVVILTSSNSPKDRALTKELGATEYFQKPPRLSEFMMLGPLVRRVLEG